MKFVFELLKYWAMALLLFFIAAALLGCANGPMLEGETLEEYRKAQSGRVSRRVACERIYGPGNYYCD